MSNWRQYPNGSLTRNTFSLLEPPPSPCRKSRPSFRIKLAMIVFCNNLRHNFSEVLNMYKLLLQGKRWKLPQGVTTLQRLLLGLLFSTGISLLAYRRRSLSRSGIAGAIIAGKPVAPGTSGGITLLGTVAAALGALTLGVVFWLLQRCRKSLASLPFIALVSGLGGSMVDSILGATVQAMYYCPACEKETERPIHNCGTRTRPMRGVNWLNNDVVNFIATIFGALLAMAMHAIQAQ